MKRFFRSFRQLRWKLTLSYTLTALVSFLLAVTLVFGGLLTWLGTHISQVILNGLGDQAVQAQPYLATAQQDPTLLKAWLQVTAANDNSQNSASGPTPYAPLFLAMVNLQGNVLAATGSQSLEPGAAMSTQLNALNAAHLRAVLKDRTGTTRTVEDNEDGTLVAIAPVLVHGKLQGALVLEIMQPDSHVVFLWFFYVTTFTGSAAVVVAIISGTIFGAFTAQGLIKRLQRLALVTSRWGQGDFTVRAVDASQDELGQMAQQLNQMAEQLENLLQTRQQLATLEERNRLARDLHDSVKQQVFAISMQLAAIRILLKRDVNAAEVRLGKAELLVKQAQQELTALIRELRPAALDGKGLVDALRELLSQWSQQHEIVANLQVEGEAVLPLLVEEALFRVAQEALSNIARHSQPTLVQFILSISEENVTLTIQDNGRGFHPEQLGARGVGLLSMQERMKALGGEATIESTPERGTRLIARCSSRIQGENQASERTPNTEKTPLESRPSL